MKRIGIDIDGVLTDIEQWQLDYSSKFYFENFGKEIIDYKGYYTDKIYGVTLKEDLEFWAKYFREYSETIEVRKFASEIIEKLHNEGYEIYIITARSGQFLGEKEIMSFEQSKKTVVGWLEKNKIFYDKIIFSPEDKASICQEEKIDVMIEDSPHNVENISKNIPVICFNAGYNEGCQNENIYRCYSWYDIYYKIKNKVF